MAISVKIHVDWSSAPPWANFLALNADGEWYWFENEPTLTIGIDTHPTRAVTGRCMVATDAPHWTALVMERGVSSDSGD